MTAKSPMMRPPLCLAPIVLSTAGRVNARRGAAPGPAGGYNQAAATTDAGRADTPRIAPPDGMPRPPVRRDAARLAQGPPRRVGPDPAGRLAFADAPEPAL